MYAGYCPIIPCGTIFVFVGYGYLALQLPFGWVAMILGLLLTNGIPLSGGSVWGAPLNSPSMWMSYLVVLGWLIGLGFAFLGKFSPRVVPVFFVLLLLLTLAGSIFPIYALFHTTSAFPLDIGIKILAFLVGAALGAISWMIAHVSLLLSAMPSSYQPQLILTVFTVSILCAVVVSIGTYFVVTSPKIGYWVLGGALGIILFLWVGFFTKLGSASWT